MSKEDKETLQCEVNEKAISQLSDREGLESFIVQVLDSFSYRYLQTRDSGETEVQKYQDESVSLLFSRSLDYKMADALKCSDEEARKGILHLAKTVPKKENPCVLYELFVDLSSLSEDLDGNIEVRAIINWGFPGFKDESKKKLKAVKLKVDDLLTLRKSLPLALEEVCEIF